MGEKGIEDEVLELAVGRFAYWSKSFRLQFESPTFKSIRIQKSQQQHNSPGSQAKLGSWSPGPLGTNAKNIPWFPAYTGVVIPKAFWNKQQHQQ